MIIWIKFALSYQHRQLIDDEMKMHDETSSCILIPYHIITIVKEICHSEPILTNVKTFC